MFTIRAVDKKREILGNRISFKLYGTDKKFRVKAKGQMNFSFFPLCHTVIRCSEME